jgi:hypothetical protein
MRIMSVRTEIELWGWRRFLWAQWWAIETWLRWLPVNLCHYETRPDVCWGEVVKWVMIPYAHRWREWFDLPGSAGQCARMGEYPYCGKCPDTTEGE